MGEYVFFSQVENHELKQKFAEAEEELRVTKLEKEELKVIKFLILSVTKTLNFLQAKTKRLKEESKEKSCALNAYAVCDIQVGFFSCSYFREKP